MTDTTAVSIFEAPNALAILTDAEKFDRFYDDVKRETDKLEIDLTTERGRKAIASMAYKVARSKTAIDDAGKVLTEEWRSQIKTVDDARRAIREKLDALKDEVRRPLTDWEAAEEARLARVDATLATWRGWAIIMSDDTVDDVRERLDALRGAIVTEAEFGAGIGIAQSLRATVEGSLATALDRLVQEAADRAELERLRAAEAERVAAAEREAEEVERARRDHAARIAEAAERERSEAARKANEEAIASRAAEAAKAEADRQHAEALAAEKRRADEAEAARAAEAKRVLDDIAAHQAEVDRLTAEQAARDKDRKHRGEVMGAAKLAMMNVGADEETAKKVVLAIVAGEIPNVTLRF